MEQAINTNPRNILIMPVVSPNTSEQLQNGQVMELQHPDSMPRPDPEPAQHSNNNVNEQDHRDEDDSNDGSEDEDDLLLAPMTATQLICIMCGTRVASTARLRRHTVKHHPEAAEMFEFLIETAVKIFPGIYAEYQAQTSKPTTSKVKSVARSSIKRKNEFHGDAVQPESETSTSNRVGEMIRNSSSTEVSTKFPNVVTAPNDNQSSVYCHAEKKPFKCEYCGAGLTCKSQYDIHLRTHTGERPYICQKCGKRFKQVSHLNDHMKVHTGDRPFICQDCGEKPKSKS
ncbi:unnamed protein product [Orchesella dallaii]|uniref:C2H2-type domain-containing protein n=1 Tax=Orchesella dallaii TaxID=48710 RepID=A0ABP1PWG5_9HEXA